MRWANGYTIIGYEVEDNKYLRYVVCRCTIIKVQNDAGYVHYLHMHGS